MTDLDQETDVYASICIHERHSHCDILAIGQNGGTVGSSLFDETKDATRKGIRCPCMIYSNRIPCLPPLREARPDAIRGG